MSERNLIESNLEKIKLIDELYSRINELENELKVSERLLSKKISQYIALSKIVKQKEQEILKLTRTTRTTYIIKA